MDQTEDREAILTALAAEHTVMQDSIGSGVNEQQARASMYLLSVSGAVVAIGLLSRSEHFLLFTAAILPMLFLAGLLTILRLVDICMEGLQCHVTIARIHGYYRTLGKAAEEQFDKGHGRWPEGHSDPGMVIGPVLGLMTTAASMIACVNAFIGGALLALLLNSLLETDLTVAIVAGIAFAVVQVVAFYIYQSRRIDLVIKDARESGVAVGEDGTGTG